MSKPRNFDTKELVDYAIEVTKNIHESIALQSEYDHAIAMDKALSNGKRALNIDRNAESLAKTLFAKKFRNGIYVLGEESLGKTKSFNNVELTQFCALLDMVDGTDLLEIGIPMWCSAIVLFDPHTPRILGAVIGQANGDIYYADANTGNAGVYRAHKKNDFDNIFLPQSKDLAKTSGIKTLEKATISFYGQKRSSFLAVAKEQPRLLEHLEKLSDENELRIHTLSGNPLMVKLADRSKKDDGEPDCRGIDLIFDCRGQLMHDVVPGIYIAIKAGAYACDLKGNEITDEFLASKLLNPSDRLTYILAATKELADEMVPLLDDLSKKKK